MLYICVELYVCFYELSFRKEYMYIFPQVVLNRVIVFHLKDGLGPLGIDGHGGCTYSN